MGDRIDSVIGVHQQALRLRAERQQLLASNIANADTPGYKARDIDFRAALEQAVGSAGAAQASAPRGAPARTDARHLDANGTAGENAAPDSPLLYRAPVQPSADGNTVDLNVERGEFAQNAVGYEASVTFIGMQLRLLLAASQGQ